MSIIVIVYLFIGNVKHLASPTFLISFRQHNHKQESLAYQGLIQFFLPTHTTEEPHFH